MNKKRLAFIATAWVIVVLVSCDKNQDLTGRNNNNNNNNNPPPTTTALKATTGFATQNGGTSGGDGGTVVVATTYAQLKQYLENTTTKYIVKVNQRIYNNSKGGSIRVANDKTLLGEGSNAFLDGIGLTILNTKNVIIRNIKFSLVSVTDRTDPAVYSPTGDEGRPQILVNSGDCISIDGGTNIWIDHCEFASEDPGIQTNQDLYDGFIDAKRNSAFITISWNYFHDHHKTHLVGAADTDNFDRRITWHHNYYRNINSRIPSYRFGTGHFVNNYLVNISGSAINSRMGACMKVESNVFENTKSPLTVTGNPTGQYEIAGNQLSGISGTGMPSASTCTATLPYTFTADAATAVKAKVLAGAGVGKL